MNKYDQWKMFDPTDDNCEHCDATTRDCHVGWQPNGCTGECGRTWRDPDYEYEKMRDN